MNDVARYEEAMRDYISQVCGSKFQVLPRGMKVVRTMGWTCPQCGVNYSPNVVRCPCTEKKNQEPPKDKSILDGMSVVTNKEFNFKAEHKTI